MSLHHLCKVNCGGTACEAPRRIEPDREEVVVLYLDNSALARFVRAILHAGRECSRLFARTSNYLSDRRRYGNEEF
jgi:hypothetical protein